MAHFARLNLISRSYFSFVLRFRGNPSITAVIHLEKAPMKSHWWHVCWTRLCFALFSCPGSLASFLIHFGMLRKYDSVVPCPFDRQGVFFIFLLTVVFCKKQDRHRKWFCLCGWYLEQIYRWQLCPPQFSLNIQHCNFSFLPHCPQKKRFHLRINQSSLTPSWTNGL